MALVTLCIKKSTRHPIIIEYRILLDVFMTDTF